MMKTPEFNAAGFLKHFRSEAIMRRFDAIGALSKRRTARRLADEAAKVRQAAENQAAALEAESARFLEAARVEYHQSVRVRDRTEALCGGSENTGLLSVEFDDNLLKSINRANDGIIRRVVERMAARGVTPGELPDIAALRAEVRAHGAGLDPFDDPSPAIASTTEEDNRQ